VFYAEQGIALRGTEDDRPAKRQKGDQDETEMNSQDHHFTQFPANLVPCVDCDVSLRLPRMKKPVVKASLRVRVEKVKSFVLRRLGDIDVTNIEFDNLEVLFKGKVLEEGKRLMYREDEFRDSIDTEDVEFRYRLKTPLSG
jgi:hypothetical protein